MLRTALLTAVFAAIVAAAQFTPTPATAQTVPPKPVYLAVGDSLTVGLYAASDTPGTWHGFAVMVAEALPWYQLEIAAVTGDGIDNTIAQLPLELADHAPEFVTVEVGINNLGNMDAKMFLRKYVKLLHILRDNGYKNAVACTVPWTGQGVDTDAYARALEFNQVINRVTPALGYKVADCWGATVGHYEYLSDVDGFHPNTAGHRAIANALLYAILRPVHWLPDVRR
jgi:lysophospholipase L1-like esterase